MQERGFRSATSARRSYGSLPQLSSRRCERRLHSATRLGCLHTRKKRVEFAVERIEPCLDCARERVAVIDRYQNGLWRVVLGDDDGSALNGHLQNAPELALRFTGSNGSGLECLAATVLEGGDASRPGRAPSADERFRFLSAHALSLQISVLSNMDKIVNMARAVCELRRPLASSIGTHHEDRVALCSHTVKG